jgi:hypothetical protein
MLLGNEDLVGLHFSRLDDLQGEVGGVGRMSVWLNKWNLVLTFCCTDEITMTPFHELNSITSNICWMRSTQSFLAPFLQPEMLRSPVLYKQEDEPTTPPSARTVRSLHTWLLHYAMVLRLKNYFGSFVSCWFRGNPRGLMHHNKSFDEKLLEWGYGGINCKQSSHMNSILNDGWKLQQISTKEINFSMMRLMS